MLYKSVALGLAATALISQAVAVDPLLREYTAILEFQIRPSELNQNHLNLLEEFFREAYQKTEDAAARVGGQECSRVVNFVNIDPNSLSQGIGSNTALQSLTLRASVRTTWNQACSEKDRGLFSDIKTTVYPYFPLRPWYGPSPEFFTFQFNRLIQNNSQQLSPAVESVEGVSEVSVGSCTGNEKVLETDTVVGLVADPAAATPGELATLTEDYIFAYNNLNRARPGNVCDLFQRRIVSAEIDLDQTLSRRRELVFNVQRPAQTTGISFFNVTAFRFTSYFFRIRFECKGCPDGTALYDDDAARRRLEDTSPGCDCPANADKFRAPTVTEFTQAFDTAIGVSREQGELSFVKGATETIEVESVQCDADMVRLISDVAVNFNGNPDFVNDLDEIALETSFVKSYNGAAGQKCDVFFRSVQDAKIQDVVERKRELRRQLVRRPNITFNFSFLFRIIFTCRGCPSGTPLFGNDGGRRVLEYPVGALELHQIARFAQQQDTCFCDVTSQVDDAPTVEEFVTTYDQTVEALQIPSIAKVEDVESESESQPLPPEWSQIGQELSGEAVNDNFGGAVAFSADGNVMAVGAQRNDDRADRSGQVRVFELVGGFWRQRGGDLDGKTVIEEFGKSVDLSSDGRVLAVGAWLADVQGRVDSGLVRIFDWTGSSWNQRGSDINGEASPDEFGITVALSSSGDTVAIGGHLNSVQGGFPKAGHVRVFDWQGNQWRQRGDDIDGAKIGDESGTSVDISADGNIVAIGAPANDGTGPNAGQVRVYQWTNNAWAQRGLDINGEAGGDFFGIAVAMNKEGSVVAVGAPTNDGNGVDSGSVRVFEWTGSSWTKRGSDLDGAAAGDRAGAAVSISDDGSIVAFGAYQNDAQGTSSGQVRVFRWTNNNSWNQLGGDIDGKLSQEQSGFSLALSGDGKQVAIGSPFNNAPEFEMDPGRVRVYEYLE
jgi:hypothetical protein